MRTIVKVCLVAVGIAFAYAIYESESTRLKQLGESKELKQISEPQIDPPINRQVDDSGLPNSSTQHHEPTKTYQSRTRIDTRYQLLTAKTNGAGAFNISVRIPEKLSNDELKLLAEEVVHDRDLSSRIGWVFFLLPEMMVENGAWAVAHFDSNIRVEVIGQSLDEDAEIKQGLRNMSDYIGLWTDNGTPGAVIIRIRKDKKRGFVFEYVSPSDPAPSRFATQLVRENRRGKLVFRDAGYSGEFFVIETNGDLAVHDREGYVVTYRKLK